MKNIFLFFILSSLGMFLFACEKAESEHAKHVRLGIRADNCDNCPIDDCCCYIELINNATTASLVFCGTTNPDVSTSPCGPVALQAPCDPIIGYYWSAELSNTLNPNEFFCVEKGASFMIGVGTTSMTSVRFTCQYGQTNPQFVTLLNLTSGEKHYYTVDNDCVISECQLQ